MASEIPKLSTDDSGIAKLSSSYDDDENPHEKATALNPMAGLLAASSMIGDSGAPAPMTEHATLDLPQAIASAKAKHAASVASTPPLPLGGSSSDPPLADERPTARPPAPAAAEVEANPAVLVKDTPPPLLALDATPRADAPAAGRSSLLIWGALAVALAVVAYLASRG